MNGKLVIYKYFLINVSKDPTSNHIQIKYILGKISINKICNFFPRLNKYFTFHF